MPPITEGRMKLRKEIEAPSTLRVFGSGWISGVIALVLAVGSLLMVLSMRFPGLLAMPETRPLQDSVWFRAGLHVVLIGAFLLSILSLVLRREKILGTIALSCVMIAAVFGGSAAVALRQGTFPIYFGLDWFVLNVLFTGFLFIPIERVFPNKTNQEIFRPEWREDLFYYLVSSMMVQILTYLTFTPARTLLAIGHFSTIRSWVGSLPFIVQFLAIMVLTDFVQYWVHRAFHRIPWLWNFHAVHHSAQSMDWIAGARMHFFEIFALRSMTVIPMFVLGFTDAAMHTYIFVVYLYSTFVHANLGWKFRFVEKVLVTPRFHHWHHGIEEEAIDVNFAVHFPWLDKLFGTYHLPAKDWPRGYGISGHPVPLGYAKQFVYPLRSANKK